MILDEKIRHIEEVDSDADNDKKLSIVLAYLEVITELRHMSEHSRRKTIFERIIFWLDEIVSPTLDVAFIYFAFGRVLMEHRAVIMHGKNCLQKAFDIFMTELSGGSYSDSIDNRRILDALQYMLDHLDIDLERLSFRDTNGNTFLHWVGICGDR
jgi:hypothetical protein